MEKSFHKDRKSFYKKRRKQIWLFRAVRQIKIIFCLHLRRLKRVRPSSVTICCASVYVTEKYGHTIDTFKIFPLINIVK